MTLLALKESLEKYFCREDDFSLFDYVLVFGKDRERQIAKELRATINDRACWDFVTLKAEMEKLAERLDGEKVTPSKKHRFRVMKMKGYGVKR